MAQNYARSNKNDYQIAKYVDNLEERVLGEKNILPKIRSGLSKLKGNTNGYWTMAVKATEQHLKYGQERATVNFNYGPFCIFKEYLAVYNNQRNVFKKEHREVQA